MKFVKPKVFQLGQTEIHDSGLHDFLAHIGADEWMENNFGILKLRDSAMLTPKTKASPSEVLAEIYSRGCYKSFGAGLNPNVTRVREGNSEHLKNVIASKHGSVLEHVSVNFAFCDVSRVFTHELCRHRVGVAISQESLRYVRLTDLKCLEFEELEELSHEDNAWFNDQMSEVFTFLEGKQREFAVRFQLDDVKNFDKKKKITSRMRRAAPIGLLTYMGWTANMRTLRHVIPLRTHATAEEEIRYVFKLVGELMVKQFPHIFYDFTFHPDGGASELGEWRCEHAKI